MKLNDLVTGKQIQKALDISRSYFWQLKQRKGFPGPVYKQGRIELWGKKEIEEYANQKLFDNNI